MFSISKLIWNLLPQSINLDKIFRNLESLSIQDRIFVISTFYSAVAVFFANFAVLIPGFGGIELILTNLIGSFCLGAIFYLSRYKKCYFKFAWISILTIVIFVNWRESAGSLGGTHMFLLFVPLISTMIFEGKQRYFAVITTLSFIPLSHLIENRFPNFIIPYKDISVRSVDSLAGHIIFFIVLLSLLNTILKSLHREKQKSYNLLLNTYPEHVIKALNHKGQLDPQFYASVSVIVTDLVNFTSLSKYIPPSDLIEELNDLYSNFDLFAKENNSSRIRTIGDGYFAVSGISGQNDNHLIDTANFALKINQYIRKRNQTHERKWEIRIGFHTGSAIASTFGKTVYQYDVFGEAVSTAILLENSCVPMEILVSEKAYHQLNQSYNLTERDTLELEDGTPMKSYTLLSKKESTADILNFSQNQISTFQKVIA